MSDRDPFDPDATCGDPECRCRKPRHQHDWPRRVLIHEGVLESMGRVEWGVPDEDGFYNPTIYREFD